MKKAIRIKYRSIFKYNDHNETITYNEMGYMIEQENDRTIVFHYENKPMEIQVKKDQVLLKNNGAVLALCKDQLIENPYQTEYGIIDLSTKLVSLEDGDTIKIKYQIYDQTLWISDVYVLIQWQVLES